MDCSLKILLFVSDNLTRYRDSPFLSLISLLCKKDTTFSFRIIKHEKSINFSQIKLMKHSDQ